MTHLRKQTWTETLITIVAVVLFAMAFTYVSDYFWPS